jgi:integrase
VAARIDQPSLFLAPSGRRFSKGTLLYYWRPVRGAFGRPKMEFYELRHICAAHLLELGVSPSDVAVQLGHRDGGVLFMSTYGHPAEDSAREYLKRAYGANVTQIRKTRGRETGDMVP